MYKLVKYTDQYRAKWNEFAVKENGTVFHLIEWKEVLEEIFGYKAVYHLAVDQGGEIVGLIPMISARDLFLRKVGMSLPFVNHMDICCRDDNAFNYIVDEIREFHRLFGLNSLELRFWKQDIKNEAGALQDNNYTFIIPLDGDEEQVLSKCSSNNRNHIRKAYKNNYFSVSFDSSNLPGFYEVYCKTMKRLGSPAPEARFFKRTLEKLPQNTVLLTVLDNDNGSVIGGMFLFAFGDTVYYQWGGCLQEYNKKYVNNFMYWEAVKYALEKGFKHLDLGRSQFESGTYRFKQQWGAIPYRLKYYKVGNNLSGAAIDRDNLGMFISLWKILPNFLTDFAGRIIIKYVLP